MRLVGHVELMEDRTDAYRVVAGKLDGNMPLRRPRRRWECMIKMNLQELGCGDVDWIDLAQNKGSWGALVNATMNCGFHKFLGIC
jgi:hypothetical protein